MKPIAAFLVLAAAIIAWWLRTAPRRPVIREYRDAAWAAAGAAAGDAETKWQSARLLQYLNGTAQ